MVNLVGVIFDFVGMMYYKTNKDISLGDYVVCATDHGTFLGEIKRIREATEEEQKKENFDVLFPNIVRIATFSDKRFLENAAAKEALIVKRTQEQANSLKLDMKVLNAHLDIDDDKVLITFTSEGRVDFRELVRILNGEFHMRIELRQIGPRDQARIVGGIGPCGLPLCCSTFLKSFDGISIAMAKNQLLSINIPKLSGQCGKLMCCLKFEDEAYAELRPLYPKIGEKFDYRNSSYTVTGLNLLSDTITGYNGENYESFTRDEFEKVKKGLLKEKQVKISLDINAGIDLSGHGVSDTNRRIAQIKKSEEKRQEEISKQQTKKPQNNNNNRNNQKGNFNPNNKSNKPYNKFNNQNRNNNYNHNNKNNNNFHNSNNNGSKKDSGFIPVSQIQDKSVLDFKPVKKDDKK